MIFLGSWNSRWQLQQQIYTILVHYFVQIVYNIFGELTKKSEIIRNLQKQPKVAKNSWKYKKNQYWSITVYLIETLTSNFEYNVLEVRMKSSPKITKKRSNMVIGLKVIVKEAEAYRAKLPSYAPYTNVEFPA